MAEVRRDLDHDVREVSRGARTMIDWKFYARKFPWAIASAALVAGYMLVPKRKAVIKPDPEMIQELVRQKKIKVESVTRHPDKAGMMKSLLLAGLTYAVKTGAQYMAQQMAAGAQQRSKTRASAEDHEPGPSPLHEPWSSTPG